MLNEKITQLVLAASQDISDSLTHALPLEKGAACPLYGAGGTLDSISLVSLVVNIEQKIEDEFEIGIILANEKAMSQRNSPFLTVGSLAHYATTLIEEAQHA